MFYFREDFVPLYLWAIGGIIICLFFLFRICYVRKKYKTELAAKETAIFASYQKTLRLMFFAVTSYMFLALPLMGYLTKEIWIYFLGSGYITIFAVCFFIFVQRK